MGHSPGAQGDQPKRAGGANPPPARPSIGEILLGRLDVFAAMADLDGEIVEVTPAVLAHARLDRDEMIGRRLWELSIWASEAESEAVHAATTTAAAGGAQETAVLVRPRGCDEDIPLRLRVTSVAGVGGGPAFVLAQDVSRGASGELVGAQDVARLNALAQLHDALVADLSHDMRPPLLSIVARGERLQDSRDPEVRQDGLEIRASALRVLQQLEQLTDVGSSERRRSELRLGDCDVVAVIADVAEQIKPITDRLGIELVTDSPRSLEASVDEDKVVSIVSNLLANAVRHAPEGGIVRCSVEVAGEDLVISVADSGAGIRDEHRQLVFERGWREPGAEAGSGRGLGLAIVRRLVAMHEGTIAVQRADEGGALLEIRLPYRKPVGKRPPVSLRRAAGRELAAQAAVADLERLIGRRRPGAR
jgi:signal transduction histidine kinase